MEPSDNVLDDANRLAEVRRFGLVGTPPESAFDRFASLAGHMFDAPMAVLSLVESDRVWFKSHIGLDVCEAPTSVSFCTHVLKSDAPFVVLNAAADPQFSTNPLVSGSPYVRFYAGAPLRTSRGERLGALAVINSQPRDRFDEADRRALANLAGIATEWIEMRLDLIESRTAA